MLISVVLVGWVIWNTDWNEVWTRLSEANPALLLASAAAVGAGIFLRTWRWQIMLEPQVPERRYGDLLDIVNLGYLANNLLPARLGDVIRSYLAAEWTPATFAFALSTTAVERVLDTLVVVTMLFGVLPFLPVPPEAAQIGTLLGIAFFGAGVVLVVMAWFKEQSERLIQAMLRPLPINEELWSGRIVALLEGFSIVRQPMRFARVLFSTVLIWAVAIASYWFVFLAFNLDLGFLAGAFVISVAALGMAVPSGPASAGTYDAAASGALQVLNVAQGLAGGVAVVLHALNFIVITLFGLWSLGKRGLTLNKLTMQAEQLTVDS
jgi:uncharacterized protein (TIRG00374 family)